MCHTNELQEHARVVQEVVTDDHQEAATEASLGTK